MIGELIVESRPPAVHVTHADDEEWIVGNPVELAPGDGATYAADKPHLYEALAPGTTGLIVMSYPARKG